MEPSKPRLVFAVSAALALGCSADPDLDRLYQEQVVCARGGTLPGIDVSVWQGTINWDRVQRAGIRYAFIRAYYGANTRDSQFDRNWREARRVGLLRGAYQWFKPLQDPTAQANRIVAAVGRLGPGDLPVVIDVEEPPADGLPSTSEYVRRLRVWYDRVRSGTGRAPIIYSGKYYWEGYLGSTAFASTPLWHPQYTSASCPNIANQWRTWAFWQYTSTGRVDGISGNVDRNRFNGTMAELNALAGIVPPPPPPPPPPPRDAAVDRPASADVPRDVAADRPAAVDVPRDVVVDRPAVTDAGADIVAAPDVTADASVPDDVAPPEDAYVPDDGESFDDAPALGDAGNVPDDAEPPAAAGDDTGGCGCSAPGRSRVDVAGPWALALVAVARRRRASRQ